MWCNFIVDILQAFHNHPIKKTPYLTSSTNKPVVKFATEWLPVAIYRSRKKTHLCDQKGNNVAPCWVYGEEPYHRQTPGPARGKWVCFYFAWLLFEETHILARSRWRSGSSILRFEIWFGKAAAPHQVPVAHPRPQRKIVYFSPSSSFYMLVKYCYELLFV